MKDQCGARSQWLEKASRAMTACGTLAVIETGSVGGKRPDDWKTKPWKIVVTGKNTLLNEGWWRNQISGRGKTLEIPRKKAAGTDLKENMDDIIITITVH